VDEAALTGTFFALLSSQCQTSREGNSSTSHKVDYLDFSPFSRSSYVIDMSFMKLQKLTFFPQLMCFALPPCVLKNTRKEAGRLEIKSLANYDAIK
jgi:hypothetical protein